jgi:hypothetical protein
MVELPADSSSHTSRASAELAGYSLVVTVLLLPPPPPPLLLLLLLLGDDEGRVAEAASCDRVSAGACGTATVLLCDVV